MRTRKFAVLVAMSLAASANAGNHEQDPKTAQLRELFTQSHAPTDADLRLGETITCIQRSAITNDYRAWTLPTFQFQKTDAVTYHDVRRERPEPFHVENDALVSRNVDPGGYRSQFFTSIRVTPSGDLISEFGEIRSGTTWSMLPSVSDPGNYNVMLYMHCVKPAVVLGDQTN